VGTSLSVAPGMPLGDTASSFDTASFGAATVVPIDRPLSPAPAPLAATVVVPDLRGWTLRAAVRALHHAGLEVQLTGGPRGTTDPSPGTAVRTGAVVRLGAGA
jgi:hypothetical protein